MRLLPMLLALPLLAFQAHAQTVPTQPGGPEVSAPNGPTPATPKHHRTTWQEHFTRANLAHDGHLTMAEARAGYPTLARHFTDIDAGKKGYVTEADIIAWHKLQRATRHSTKDRTDNGLRPRPVMQRGMTQARPISTATGGAMLPMNQPDASPASQQATSK